MVEPILLQVVLARKVESALESILFARPQPWNSFANDELFLRLIPEYTLTTRSYWIS